MKIQSLLTLLLAGSLSISASAQSLTFGAYDDIDIEAYDDSNTYGNGANANCPINLYYTSSGSQTLFLASELGKMAGKLITGVSYKFYNEGGYSNLSRNVKVLITEVTVSDFENNANGNWLPFSTVLAGEATSQEVTIDGIESLAGGEVELTFSTPYYYAGDNNLVVTVMADGSSSDDTEAGNCYVFHYANELPRRTMNFANDSKQFTPFLTHEQLATSTLGYPNPQNAPACSFAYTDGTAPASTIKPYKTTSAEDFDIEGVTTYIVKVNGDKIATEATQSAQPGTVVLVETALQPSFTQSATPAANADNALLLADAATTAPSNAFAFDNGEQGPGFYRATQLTAGQAYVIVPGANADFLPLDGESTAVTDLNASQPTDGPTYNLMGQPVDNTYKGIAIRNGKKLILR